MTSRTDRVPSPADFVAGYSARELLAEITDPKKWEHPARVYRMQQAPIVFCLTIDKSLATLLLDMGALPFRPVHWDDPLNGGYERTRGGTVEWDLVLHPIRLDGEETLWEALS